MDITLKPVSYTEQVQGILFSWKTSWHQSHAMKECQPSRHSTLIQSWFNFSFLCWFNVEIMLDFENLYQRWNPNVDSTLIFNVESILNQYWFNVLSTLFQPITEVEYIFKPHIQYWIIVVSTLKSCWIQGDNE